MKFKIQLNLEDLFIYLWGACEKYLRLLLQLVGEITNVEISIISCKN